MTLHDAIRQIEAGEQVLPGDTYPSWNTGLSDLVLWHEVRDWLASLAANPAPEFEWGIFRKRDGLDAVPFDEHVFKTSKHAERFIRGNYMPSVVAVLEVRKRTAPGPWEVAE